MRTASQYQPTPDITLVADTKTGHVASRAFRELLACQFEDLAHGGGQQLRVFAAVEWLLEVVHQVQLVARVRL